MLKTSAYVSILIMFSGQCLYAHPASWDQMLKKFDKNKDDRISFSEAPNHIQESFHIHDINRDGYISGTELGTITLKPSSYKRPAQHPTAHRLPPPYNHPPRRPNRRPPR